MATDRRSLGITLAAVLPVDPDLAASLAASVAREIRKACCEFHQGDLDAGRLVCFPEDWPLHPPNDSDGYQAARAHAAGSCARYDRAIVERFQEAAGLDPDGDYGPATVGALRFYGISNPPMAVFGNGEVQYVVMQSPETPEPTEEQASGGFLVWLGLAAGFGTWFILRKVY